MSTWYGDAPPCTPRRLGAGDWARIGLRGVPLAVVVFGGLAVLLLLRLVERPLCGPDRPVTPHVTTAVCRAALWLIGLGYGVRGRPMTGQGAQVANHASWLDIFVLNACQTVYFVSKAEVARWPGIGWLARATGTVFIARDRREAPAQTALFRDRTLAGHRLLFFPEGTSSDSQRILPFKPTLFAAFFTDDLRETCAIQAVTVTYHAPAGADPRLYGWWGDMEFGAHFLQVLALPRQGRVVVQFHDPIAVSEVTDRKALAQLCETRIREAFHTELSNNAITC
ncbi:lysophospholipid acyltransferase family protein [Dinoroseobacter sp. PD6]|uniref:lysophospholipid acyltransferase family protein n=1 Tax=Dinoroseobacter sp. PD6 TaxID=3028384 RepID=UPI00237C33FF|nr:lysophospholipid acyltransferase family protein [Dinoroseobacter sp. PD6]MDD9715696.1 lysophospholipid acyltransferase family protein [Dinoroseobacter sp. PD6]